MAWTIIERYRAAFAGLPREVWLLSFAIFVNRCGTMVLPFLTLYCTSQVGMSEASAGRLISVYGLGAVCGAYLGGRLVEAWGALRLQTGCLFLTVPAFLLLPMWRDWWALAGSLFALSLVSEGVRPANATAIAKLTTRENRARAFALQRLAANLGFSFGPAIGGVLAVIDYRLLFFVDAATTFLAACCLLWFFGWRRLPGEAPASRRDRLSTSPLADRFFVAYLALILLSSLVFFQFGTTYPLYLRDHFGLSKPQIGLAFAVNTTTIVVFEMVLIDAIKGWPLIRTIGSGCVISCIGFGMLPFGASGVYCAVAMLVVTIGEMLFMPLSAAFVAQRTPTGSEGRYLGWHAMTFSLASVVGPTLGSTLYAIDRDAVWYVSLGLAVAVGFGFHVLRCCE